MEKLKPGKLSAAIPVAPTVVGEEVATSAQGAMVTLVDEPVKAVAV